MTMSLFTTTTARQLNIGLAILRLAAGTIFIAHGGQKLFVYGFAGVTGAFGQMGVPMPELVGPFVAFVELLGGFALVAGLLTRLASASLASIMIVAILLVHAQGGFFNPGGIEFPLSLLGATLMLAITGAGAWSLDNLIGGRQTQPAVVSGTTKLRRAA